MPQMDREEAPVLADIQGQEVNNARLNVAPHQGMAAGLEEPLAPGWDTEPMLRVLRREGNRGRAASGAEQPLLPLRSALQTPQEMEGQDSLEWQSYAWQPAEEIRAHRVRGAGVTTFARRLMCQEKARMRRRGPLDFLDRRRGGAGRWGRALVASASVYRRGHA